ncbi:hypothetical protein GFL38_11280 [Rhizobium leguminosarum bv. viciae]|uniref:hypothetical protein n=1 Tax=Rhizobium ruizarguesonis TaxID=2081791 RepID=UPI00143F451C|nr:hypothetical protein [Rhizobium ruizarguesonis]NKJ72835.1 hypothetical protein [Rhizobium leguminosarum bv. viciae]NKQ80516.1 hypothetical protein [Rhizobium ruizarguesonis]
MDEIYPPNVPNDDPDRHLRCQDALHLEFAAFIDRAVAAGWRADEVLTTIIELADNHALMLAADADLEAALAVLKKDALDSFEK